MGSRAEVLGVRIHLPPAVSQTKCRTTIGRCSLGPEGQEETCEASYIAGSGGTHSIVRDMIGAGFPAALIGKCSTSPMSGRPALRSMARCTSISTRPIFWRSLSRQNPLPSGCSVISLSAATHEFTLTHRPAPSRSPRCHFPAAQRHSIRQRPNRSQTRPIARPAHGPVPCRRGHSPCRRQAAYGL